MTIKLDPIFVSYLFLLKKIKFHLLSLLMIYSYHLFSSSLSKKEFVMDTGFFSDYKVKSGYDPFRAYLMQPYVVSDNFVDYFAFFGFKYKNKKIKFKTEYSFCKDLTTSFLARSTLNSLDINLRDSEVNKLSSSKFQWKAYFAHQLFFSFSYFSGVDLSIENSSAFLPAYLTYKRTLASQTERESSFYFGFFYHNYLGKIGIKLPFKIETSSRLGLKSNNFFLGGHPFLSYDILFQSKRFLGGLAKFYSQFSFRQKRFNKGFYNTRKFSWSGRLKINFEKFLSIDTTSIFASKMYTFDRGYEEEFWVNLDYLFFKTQKLNFRYEFLKSRFEKNKEYSFVSQKIAVSYSLKLGYTL